MRCNIWNGWHEMLNKIRLKFSEGWRGKCKMIRMCSLIMDAHQSCVHDLGASKQLRKNPLVKIFKTSTQHIPFHRTLHSVVLCHSQPWKCSLYFFRDPIMLMPLTYLFLPKIQCHVGHSLFLISMLWPTPSNLQSIYWDLCIMYLWTIEFLYRLWTYYWHSSFTIHSQTSCSWKCRFLYFINAFMNW